jgi:outer membrane protein
MKKLFLLTVLALPGSIFCVPRAEAGETRPYGWAGWMIGAGYVWAPGPYAGGARGTSDAFLLIGYAGERLTWLGPYLSYRLSGDESFELTAVAEARFEGIEDDVTEGELKGLHAREPALELGFDFGYGPLFASARADVSGRHDGFMLALGVEKEWHVADRWGLKGRIGTQWKDSKLTDYLYGIDDSETGFGLSTYAPGSSLNYQASVRLSHSFNDAWLAFAAVSYELLADEVTSSPIVDSDYDLGAFAGIAYRLGSRSGN